MVRSLHFIQVQREATGKFQAGKLHGSTNCFKKSWACAVGHSGDRADIKAGRLGKQAIAMVQGENDGSWDRGAGRG